MFVDAYLVNLAVLVALIASGIYSRTQKQQPQAGSPPENSVEAKDKEEAYDGGDTTSDLRFRAFRNRFLRVYVLAVGADWLQGPFIYSLYRHTHNLAEPTIGALFATGFVCGAVSASFAGALADRYGRKLACMLYCVIYSVSCLTMLSGDLNILFFGRALGGVSTTLLFTTFDAWMVSELNRQGFAEEGRLSSIFGEMSTANGFVAIGCGVVSQFLVQLFASEKAPFMASIVCLMCALLLISRYWTENYGVSAEGGSSTKSAARAALADPRLLAVGFTACFLEGSMYIMVFYWSEAIISARALAGTPGAVPFGLIFANFMSAMTLGSLSFGHATREKNSIQRSSHSVQLAAAISACALLVVVLVQGELFRFWALCAFEFCLGLYFPSMGFLKGNVIGDEHRGKIYGLMRLPLNIFVGVSLSSVKEGDAYRDQTFMICSGFILAATFFMSKYVRG